LDLGEIATSVCCWELWDDDIALGHVEVPGHGRNVGVAHYCLPEGVDAVVWRYCQEWFLVPVFLSERTPMPELVTVSVYHPALIFQLLQSWKSLGIQQHSKIIETV
jgi:hypothetical protein